MLKSLKENLYIYLLPLFIVLIGVIIRTKILFLNNEPYQDFVSLAVNILKPYSQLFHSLDFAQAAPPFFMVISKFLVETFNPNNILEYNDFILRIIPYLAGVFSLPLFVILVQQMFKNKYLTWFSSFFFTFNYFYICYSLEFKQYSLETCMTVLLLLIFYNIDIKKDSIKKLLLISLFFAIIPWFSSISIIILIAGYIVLLISLIKEKYFNLSKILLLSLPLFISLILFYFFYLKNLSESYYCLTDYWKDYFLTFDNFMFLFKNSLSWFFPISINKDFYFYAFIILNILFLIFNNGYKYNYKAKFLCLFPIFLFLIISFLNFYPFYERFLLFLLPLLIILIFQFVFLLKDNKFTSIAIILVLSYFYFQYFNIPIERYIVQENHIRSVFKLLKEKNPDLKNVIGNDAFFRYFAGKKIYFHDIFFEDFIYSDIPAFLNETKDTEFWIYIPEYCDVYNEKLISYLESNKNIKIIDIFRLPEDPRLFVVHIEKI